METKDLKREIDDLSLENFRLRSILINFFHAYVPEGKNMQLDVAHARAKLYFHERNSEDGNSTPPLT